MQTIKFPLTPDQIFARTQTLAFIPAHASHGLTTGQRYEAVDQNGDPIPDPGGSATVIEITGQTEQALNAIIGPDIPKAGFPWLSRSAFIGTICEHYNIDPNYKVTRIEFKYLELTK